MTLQVAGSTAPEYLDFPRMAGAQQLSVQNAVVFQLAIRDGDYSAARRCPRDSF